MGIVELFEIGFFTAFFNWSSPFLTLLIYLCVTFGVLLHILLHKKCKKQPLKWLLIGLCGVGVVACELLHQAITGWDRLAVDILYGAVLCVLIGAVITAIVFWCKSYKNI